MLKEWYLPGVFAFFLEPILSIIKIHAAVCLSLL